MLQRSFATIDREQPVETLPVATSRAITLREIFRILYRRRRIIAITTIVVGGLAAAFIAYYPPYYTASSKVLVDPRRSQAAEEQISPPTSQTGDQTSLIGSQVLLVESPPVLRRVVDALKLADDPEFGRRSSWFDSITRLVNFGSTSSLDTEAPQDAATAKAVDTLQRRLKTKREELTSVIDIAATSRDPAKASAIANAVTDAYLDELVKSKYETSRIAAQWFNKRLDDLKARQQALQDDLVKTQGQTNSGNSQVRLRTLVSELDTNRRLYQSLLARYQQTTAQENLALPDSRVVARAAVPAAPSFPKPTLTLALAIVIGLGVGCMLALTTDHLDPRIKTMRQAEDITNIPALAAIPLVGRRELARQARRQRKALKRRHANDDAALPIAAQLPLMRCVLDQPTSLFAEAVRSVRLAVQHGASGRSASKVIVMSSSVDGEGKTTLAVNLALSLATIGMRTILVDGDLRNPETTRSLCPKATAGLFEVAAGQAPLEQAVLVDRATGLAVLPSPPRNDAFINEFVFTGAMSDLLRDLRRRFDFVIVDAPPLMPLVDARALAQQADDVVLAIRWDATPQDVVLHAIETLGPAADRILGTVLTRVDLRQLRFYDYYRSSSYIEAYPNFQQPRA